MKTLRMSLVGVVSVFMLIAAPVATFAGDTADQPAANAQAAPAEAAPQAAAGCPYSEGPCCATCQEKLKQGQAMDPDAADCPCKRAKQAQKGS